MNRFERFLYNIHPRFWWYYLRYLRFRLTLEIVTTIKALRTCVPLFTRACIFKLRRRVPLQDALYTVIKSSDLDSEFKEEALRYLREVWNAKEVSVDE